MQRHMRFAFFTAALVLSSLTVAAETPEFTLVIKNHRFEPSELSVPAGRKIKLVVDNQDPTPEEFESHSLKREKVIKGGSKATIFIGPLQPGSYEFFGEYHESTAKGKIIVQ
jgi:plastocyanin